MSDQKQQEIASQNAGTFIIATALFTLIYMNVHILWLIFLGFAVIGWIGMTKEDMADEHKVRYRIFLASLATSSLIGIAWQAMSG